MKNYLAALLMAFGSFSVIPVPNVWREESKSKVILFLPLVGIVVGALWYLLAFLLLKAGVPFLAAALLAVFPYLVTGFMHLDGFMDCMDAIMSRRPVEDKHRILKDPASGTFAVAGFGVILLLGFASFFGILTGGAPMALVFAPAASRAAAGICILAITPIGHSQYAAMQDANGKYANMTVLAAMLFICLFLAFLLGGFQAFFPVICASVVSFSASIYASRQFKGISGDVAGFSITLGDLASVILISII